MDAETKAARKKGVEFRYGHRVLELILGDHGIAGVRGRCGTKPFELRATAVVLACGGFEANREWRTRFLGPGWDMATVRGTRYNQGDGIKMALDIGAQSYGHWSGCHAVAWERNAPAFGDLYAVNNSYRHSYPWGVMVNARGERFVDEGHDAL